jgi:tol-pal system protein YbgF
MATRASLCLLASLIVTTSACINAKGEGQVAFLRAGLDSEFPEPVPAVESGHPMPSPVARAETVPASVPIGVESVASEPAASPPVASEDADGARPTIRVVGPPKGARAAGQQDRIEMTVPGPEEASQKTAKGDRSAKDEFARAASLVQGRDYDRAIEALGTFVIRWPDDPAVEAAMYWRGEAYAAKGELLSAIDAFEAALARFPDGPKAPDSLLALAACSDKLGNHGRSQAYLERLARDFPKSDAARRAPHVPKPS